MQQGMPNALSRSHDAPIKVVQRFRRGVPDDNEATIIYQTSSPASLQTPPVVEEDTAPGAVFQHCNTVMKTLQTWIHFGSNDWRLAQEGMAHPTLDDRFLWWRNNGNPSWITSETLRGYVSKRRSANMRRRY